jgi:hypothetical protein
MKDYEILLIDRNGALSLYATESHLSDDAAIRAAQSIAKDGYSFEVWRGGVCVFSDAQRTQPSVAWHLTAAR